MYRVCAENTECVYLQRRILGEAIEIGSDGLGQESELLELRIGRSDTENSESFIVARHFPTSRVPERVGRLRFRSW
jgi:hypothetical protein